MTELEQGCSRLPVPHRELGTHNSEKKFTFVVIWNYTHLHFPGEWGHMKNNDAIKWAVKRRNASLKWNLGAFQWDELSGDHPCRVLKNR